MDKASLEASQIRLLPREPYLFESPQIASSQAENEAQKMQMPLSIAPTGNKDAAFGKLV